MHLLVIGATGPSGEAFTDLALKEGHRVSLYLRNPPKLQPRLREACTLHVGQFTDEDKWREALRDDVDAVISFAGPPTGISAPLNRGTPITDGYRILFRVMQDCGVRRVSILSDPCYTVAEDRVTLKWRLGVAGVRLVGGSGYAELRGASILTAAQSELDWTIFRVPFLTNGAETAVHAGYLGDGHDGMLLSRLSLARWCLGELATPRWLCKAPKLCNVAG